MKLFVKIFILTAVLISVALGMSGYMMITSSFNNALERETEIAMTQFQSGKIAFQTAIMRNENVTVTTGRTSGSSEVYAFTAPTYYYGGGFAELNAYAALETKRIAELYDADKNLVFKTAASNKFALSDDLRDNTTKQSFKEADGEYYIVVEGDFVTLGEKYYYLSATSIMEIVQQKSEMLMNFTGIYVITMIICLIFIMIFTGLLTRPINKLTSTSNRIANGEYGVRIIRGSNDEIGTLSDNFNKMAQAIESKIDELSLGIKQKEDFMASFAHELKTPLTSVIGYADMIYQKDLPRAEVKKSAFYIYSEGMRLESLSLKLLDLIILGKRDFVLEETSAAEIASGAVEAVSVKASEFGAGIDLNVEDAQVKVEYDLMRTLLLNLLDNAVKSGGDKITLDGEINDGSYVFRITDNGRGIPKNELMRIKEAFYMVDKSRARKQHGAGLGLALAERIAEIHGTTLEFNSEPGAGTAVTLNLALNTESGDYFEGAQ